MEVWTRTRYVPILLGAYRCMPLHAGGYYFGSVNQERYSTFCHAFRVLFTQTGKSRYMIQRYARKMHGRVFGEIVLNVWAFVC